MKVLVQAPRPTALLSLDSRKANNAGSVANQMSLSALPSSNEYAGTQGLAVTAVTFSCDLVNAVLWRKSPRPAFLLKLLFELRELLAQIGNFSLKICNFAAKCGDLFLQERDAPGVGGTGVRTCFDF